MSSLLGFPPGSKIRRLGKSHHPRRGAVMVMFGVTFVMLLGLLGLVIDGGFLFSTHRQVQNAADAAALAFAMHKLVGEADDTAMATANQYVQVHNGLTDAQLLVLGTNVHVPPINGKHIGKPLYVEVIVTAPVQTVIIHILGIAQINQVQARAVATWGELRTAGEGAVVLDPRPSAAPGFNVSGGGTVRVRGGIFDNNEGGGVDSDGNPVWPNDPNRNPVAASAGQPNSETGIYTTSFRVVGGVNNPAQFKNIDSGTSVPNILHAGTLPIPDPLATLDTPYVGNGLIYPSPTDDGTWGHVTVAANSEVVPDPAWVDPVTGAVTLQPGVYKSLKITGGVVTLSPGIYVISAGNNKALQINGGVVTALGVMFYNTGANYDPMTGEPDASDPYDPNGLIPPPGQAPTQFGDVTLNAGTQLFPIDTSDPDYDYSGTTNIQVFDGMLFFQRRSNPLSVEIQGNSEEGFLGGTIYGKWARFKISGQGIYDAQFIVGSMTITGTGNVTFTFAGQGRGKAPAVFLVE